MKWKSATLTAAEINGHTATGDIQPRFQHLPSKAPGVVSLKKTCGWNPTLLLGLHRLERSSCHCACHYSCVSNGWLANVSRALGTSESPPALSDWGVIYLSASTSTPSLLNPPPPSLSPGDPMEDVYSRAASKSINETALGSPGNKCLRWKLCRIRFQLSGIA